MRLALVALVALCLFRPVPVVADTVSLTTLEWPPYVDAAGKGTSTDAVRQVFAKAGHDVAVAVFPWNRAVAMAAEGDTYAGVYPEYYAAAEDAEKGGKRCLYSKSFGTSPVGFVQRDADPISWSEPADLARYRIGVVEGYHNEERFDGMVATGALKVDAATSDTLNLRKVAARRIDAAVIDREVMAYLLANDASLKDLQGRLSFNDRLLAEHGLYICFQNSERGRKLRDAFNAAL